LSYKGNICLTKSNFTDEKYVPHPSNPHKYIICYSRSTFRIMECPNNLVYNEDQNRCDHDQKDILGRCFSQNPCLNEGTCVDLPMFQYKCECATGFMGKHCEKEDKCASVDCGTNGQCIRMAEKSLQPFYCLCSGGKTFGLNCNDNQKLESNPCSNYKYRQYPTNLGIEMFVDCEGNSIHIKQCTSPLVFNTVTRQCDWPLNYLN
jgi:hypothetical protein